MVLLYMYSEFNVFTLSASALKRSEFWALVIYYRHMLDLYPFLVMRFKVLVVYFI
jgi:hypothetical protein